MTPTFMIESIKRGNNMTAIDVIGRLNLLAVVIFGVIAITKK